MPNLIDFEDSFTVAANRVTRLILLSLHREFRKAGLDVTPEMYYVLGTLQKADGLAQGQLAQKVEKDMPTLSRILDNLEKRKLVIRVPDQLDRRNRRILLTSSGKITVNKLNEIVQQFMGTMKQGIDEDDFVACKNIMRRIYQNLSSASGT